jgi:hypothetical protein
MPTFPARPLTLTTLALGFLTVPAPPASACSPPEGPQPAYTALGSTVPADGTKGVEIDAPVLLDLQSNEPGPSQSLSVVVTEADTGAAVAGDGGRDAWGRAMVVWKASAPLRPLTRYRVVAQVKSPTPIPAGVMGRERIELTFTTGEARTPPLALAGRLEATLESYEAPDYSTCTPGLCNCFPTGKLRATRARVKLPLISGGASQRGYMAAITATAERPYDFAAARPEAPRGSAALLVQPGQAGELEVLLDGQSPPYRPCFALRVEDPARAQIIGEPVCLTAMVPIVSSAGPITTPDGGTTGGGTTDGGTTTVTEPTSGGCSLARAPRPGWGWPALATLAALVALRRRRR